MTQATEVSLMALAVGCGGLGAAAIYLRSFYKKQGVVKAPEQKPVCNRPTKRNKPRGKNTRYKSRPRKHDRRFLYMKGNILDKIINENDGKVSLTSLNQVYAMRKWQLTALEEKFPDRYERVRVGRTVFIKHKSNQP
jgi:hypothetical protein